MLTSCGKSAGLLNNDKKADNIKQPWTDYVKDYKTATFVISAVILVGSVLAVKWIVNKINNKQPKKLKSLPKPCKDFRSRHFLDIGYFAKIFSGEISSYAVEWDKYSVRDLIFIYHLEGVPYSWQDFIIHRLIDLNYDVSTLE
jgi:hypothetical protein